MLQPAFGLAPGLILNPQLSIDPCEFGYPLLHFRVGVDIGAMDCDFTLFPEAKVAGRKHHGLNARILQSVVGDDFKWNPRAGDVSKPEDRGSTFALPLNRA